MTGVRSSATLAISASPEHISLHTHLERQRSTPQVQGMLPEGGLCVSCADTAVSAAVLTWHSNAGVGRRGAGDAAWGGRVDDQHDLAGVGVQRVCDGRLADHDHPVDAGGAVVAHAELLGVAHLQVGATQALTCRSPPRLTRASSTGPAEELSHLRAQASRCLGLRCGPADGVLSISRFFKCAWCAAPSQTKLVVRGACAMPVQLLKSRLAAQAAQPANPLFAGSLCVGGVCEGIETCKLSLAQIGQT